MENNIELIAKQNGITSENKLNELMRGFADNFSKAKELATDAKNILVTDENQLDLMAQAREKRLELKNIRVEVEKTRKTLKEESIREGKAIDGVANIIKALIIPVEEYLEKQERFAEIIRQEKLAKLKAEREMKLSRFVEDISLYNLDNMEDEVFDRLLINVEAAYNAKIEAEKKAEQDRIAKEKADKEEQERIRLENEQLKKEAEERERKFAEEQKKRDEQLAKEREAQRKALEVEQKKREEIENRLRKEKEEKEKKEREERLLEEAKKKAEEETKRKALLAPDKDKLIKLASDINSINYPALSSDEAMGIVREVKQNLYKIADEIIKKANNLK